MIAVRAPRVIGWGGLAIVAAALLLRLYFVSVAQVDQPLRADAGQYFRIALNAINYHTFSTAIPSAAGVTPDSYRAPGYPALIAILNAFIGDTQRTYWAMLLLQCLLGAGTVALSLLLALRVMPRPWAYAAAALVAVWPHLITLGGYVLTETVFGFLVILSGYAAVVMLESRSRYATAIAGSSLGMAALVNQIVLGFSIPLVAWFCFSRRSMPALVLALLAVGPPALWAVRDAHVESASLKSGSGRLMENVLVGMEPDFIPRYKDGGNEPAAVEARQRIVAGQNLFAASPGQALADIGSRLAAQPGRMALWYLTKPARYWAWSIEQGYGDVYVYPMVTAPFHDVPALRIVASLCHGLNTILMIAAFVGCLIYITSARRSADRFCLAGGIVTALFLYATVAYTILNPDARYAVPFRPFEIILAVMTAYALADWARRKRNPKTVA